MARLERGARLQDADHLPLIVRHICPAINAHHTIPRTTRRRRIRMTGQTALPAAWSILLTAFPGAVSLNMAPRAQGRHGHVQETQSQ